MKNDNSEKLTSTFEFDKNLFSSKAIKRAIYDLSYEAGFDLQFTTEGKIQVTINKKTSTLAGTAVQNFERLVLYHQVRLEVEEDYRVIRQIIVAQAFAPCENLQSIVGTLKQNDKTI